MGLAAGCVTAPAAVPTAGGTPAPSAPAARGAASSLPDFELGSVDGDRVRLSDYLGRSVVVMSFWDTWCEPCKTELPHLDRMYRAHKDAGLVVLAISMDDPTSVALVAPYVRESGFAIPVLLDTSGQATNLYNVHKNAPYTVVIDRTGRIARESAGFEPGSEKLLEEQLVKLLTVEKTP